MNTLSDPTVRETLLGVFRWVLPEIALIGTACVLFLLGCFWNRRGLWFTVSLAGVGLAAALAAVYDTTLTLVLPPLPIVPDAAAEFTRWMALASAMILILVSWPEVSSEYAAEYYGCLLVAVAGTSLAGRANDLITLFLALELLSIPTYILLYLPGRTRLNQEAAVKYFLLSILSSAIMLFGFSYLYGLCGTTNLSSIIATLADANSERLSPLSLLAAVLVVVAIGFRITAVPLHFYAPDVYEGAPPGVVAQLAFLPKVAGFVALARVLGLFAVDPRRLPFDANTQLPLLLWILAVVSMCVGNVLALLQDNFRRMLAYSGVAHAGYMLIGIIVACSLPDARAQPGVGGMDSLFVYLVAYGAMTIGALGVILFLSTPSRHIESIDDLAGLSSSHPVTAASMAIFMFSLIGLPLTAGFAGKLLLFYGAIEAPSDSPTMRNLYRVLAVVAAVNAAIAAYYYLRVVGAMYLRSPIRPTTDSRSLPTFLAIVLMATATVAFGIYPEPLKKAARIAAPVSQPTTSPAR